MTTRAYHPSNGTDGFSLGEMFTYHAPTPPQQESYREIRRAALDLAAVIVACCPDCADRTAAIRKVREAVMTANAAVALSGSMKPLNEE